ncbi:MAG: phosphatidylserine decarboxylase [Planctomycetota bacterium]
MVKDGVYYGLALSAAGIAVSLVFGAAWGAPFFLVAAFCLYFFRDPERQVPGGPVAVAPSDGKVVHIRPYEDGTRRVSIFLNIFDVHVNRVPIAGEIIEKSYQRGRFLLAHREAASVENEQAALTIQGERTKVVVKQIAGAVARRIVCNKAVGDSVDKGERFGLIKFGSRMDVFLGPEWDLLVRPGDRVKAGSSVLARQRE